VNTAIIYIDTNSHETLAKSGAYDKCAAIMVCTIWCGDSMMLVFYGARQYGAMVQRIFCSLEFLVTFIRAVFKLSVSNATN